MSGRGLAVEQTKLAVYQPGAANVTEVLEFTSAF
jgi:hypothetical protein